eukprot:4719579-Pleurochrysis_carterae.AAC.1
MEGEGHVAGLAAPVFSQGVGEGAEVGSRTRVHRQPHAGAQSRREEATDEEGAVRSRRSLYSLGTGVAVNAFSPLRRVNESQTRLPSLANSDKFVRTRIDAVPTAI